MNFNQFCPPPFLVAIISVYVASIVKISLENIIPHTYTLISKIIK